ncbi:MAG: radical SAM protein [Deltaproteobacteria bacterium]
MKTLLINPHIYDFAAYNFWSAPMGLLYLGSVLRKNNIEIKLIDCLDVVEEKRKADGRAPFIKKKVVKPESLKSIRKSLRRYGISREKLNEELSHVESPDLILVTSIMTYWYAGAKDVLEIARKRFPSSKIVLGGIYPSLCYEHAKTAMEGANLIVKNNETEQFYGFVEREFGITLPFKPSMYDFDSLPYPCFDLYNKIHFIPLLTSYGCMYRCTFCATPYMHPGIVRRSGGSVVNEIVYWYARGVEKYVLYDDNFLYRASFYAKPILRGIIKLPFPISIYNPNAINASLIDDELANLLLAAGFKEVRIGLEAINPDIQKSLDGKVNRRVFERAIGLLLNAGFTHGSISAYILAGLPLQRWKDVKTAIDYLAGLGVNAHIAEYTPIPHTPLFEEFYPLARYPIADDPIYQNNALFPFAWEGFTEDNMLFLKQYAREKNSLIDKSGQ